MKNIEELEKYRNLKVVVTGGAGFIGSHLVERLLELGSEVTVIDNFLNGNKLEHMNTHNNLFIHKADVTRYEDISTFFIGKDIVFHLAAVVGVEETQAVPIDVLDVEIKGTINVLDLAVQNNIKRFVFASSSEVYGDSKKRMIEDEHLYPKSTYAISKLVAEEYCKAYYRKYNLEFTALRYFNSYGPRQDKRFVISRFITQSFQGEPIYIYGDGQQTRDFTYVKDSINMSLIAGLRKETVCEIINIGTGKSVPIKRVADLVTGLTGNNKKPIFLNYGGYRPLDIEIFNRLADTQKAEKLLGYQSSTSLETGIKDCINWYIKTRNGA